MRTQMQHLFSQVPQVEIPRSSFNRTHTYKTAFDEGQLIPFLVDEVLPGDTFNVDATIFARLATPIFPTMDNMQLETFYFAVPNRLVWANWKKFCGEQVNPGDSTDFSVPQIVSPTGGWLVNSLADYFGLPVGKANVSANALPFRSYNLIWNEWFRDENLQNSLTVNTADSTSDDNTLYSVRRINKYHDYFTSCLPWPQKGPGVNLPLGTTAPVLGIGTFGNATTTSSVVFQSNGTSLPVGTPGFATGGAGVIVKTTSTGAQSATNHPEIYADLSSATAATINSLREAFALQRYAEKNARSGTRYIEILKGHFGVTCPDYRLQRPEFLGGGKQRVNITPVMQTSSTDAESPQGNLSGYGVSAGGGHTFTKSFTEHCVLIGLLAVRSDLTYQQGIHKMWTRQTKYDFYWPSFAHLGEQAVYTKELYCTGVSSNDNTVFGYQERYAEYRYGVSKITSVLRSGTGNGLDAWHYAQEFTSAPTLGSTFIEEDAPVDRTIAVSAEPHFIADIFIKNKTVRPMPVYSVPGAIDHF